jgi:hypothetical protein
VLVVVVPAKLVARIANVELPEIEGKPEITPVVGSIDKPAGKEPTTEYVGEG